MVTMLNLYDGNWKVLNGYCQAQPKLQLAQAGAELALFLQFPTSHTPTVSDNERCRIWALPGYREEGGGVGYD